MAYAGMVSRWVVGTILLVGSLTKLSNFEWFTQVVQKYHLTPRRGQSVLALVIIGAELITGCLLLSGRFLPWSAYFACALFGIFIVAILINLIRRKSDIPCGCNGLRKETRISWYLISRNFGLIGLTLLAVQGGNLSSRHVQLYAFVFSVLLFGISFRPQSACSHGHEVHHRIADAGT